MPERLARLLRSHPRVAAFATWLALFSLPPYIERPGRAAWAAPLEALSGSLANRTVELFWPSLLLHLAVYYSLYEALARGRVRPFRLTTALIYAYVGLLQSTALTLSYGLVVITSNMAVSLILAALWLRGRGPGGLGEPPSLLLPLALFAFASPLARTSLSAPPWWWMWERVLAGEPAYAVPALVLDALAGYGAVAYCLYTPLALYVALRLRPVPEYAVRLAGFTGMAYATIIIVRAVAAVAGGLAGFGAFMALWNAVLHVPLLASSLYAVAARY